MAGGLRACEKPVQGMATLEGLILALKGRACHDFAQNASTFALLVKVDQK